MRLLDVFAAGNVCNRSTLVDSTNDSPSDILAEMSTLPPSDISKHQEDIAYPSGVYEQLPDSANFDSNNEHEKTMWTYSSQIHLRVILNEAHNTLYGASHGMYYSVPSYCLADRSRSKRKEASWLGRKESEGSCECRTRSRRHSTELETPCTATTLTDRRRSPFNRHQHSKTS